MQSYIGSEIKERPPAFRVQSSAAGLEADGANSGRDHDELLLADRGQTGKDDWQFGEQMAMVEGDQVYRSLS